MTEITYGTIEDYGDLDWLLGATVTVDDIPRANGVTLKIQYNQNEFKKSSYYCTAYMCFTVYSAYTGNLVAEDRRREFIDICLEEGLIIEGEGGYLHKVFNRWIKYLEAKLGIKYQRLRVEMGTEDARKVLDKGYAIGTGFKANAVFNKDKNDNCIVDKVESVEGTKGSGHALGDYLMAGVVVKHMRMDNYHGVNKCNTYQIIPYDEFVANRKLHFQYGYILTSLPSEKMSQAGKQPVNRTGSSYPLATPDPTRGTTAGTPRVASSCGEGAPRLDGRADPAIGRGHLGARFVGGCRGFCNWPSENRQ